MATRIQTENPEMILPTFHMNGNSPKTLGKQYLDALHALSDFSEEFYKVDFHQRDYYVQAPENWEKAILQRDKIKQHIEEIRKYLDNLATHAFESVV